MGGGIQKILHGKIKDIRAKSEQVQVQSGQHLQSDQHLHVHVSK